MSGGALLNIECLTDQRQSLHQLRVRGIKHSALRHGRGLVGHLHGLLGNCIHGGSWLRLSWSRLLQCRQRRLVLGRRWLSRHE